MRCIVNATIRYAAWVTVDADTPEEALAEASELPAYSFDYDSGSAEISFDVDPVVEVAS